MILYLVTLWKPFEALSQIWDRLAEAWKCGIFNQGSWRITHHQLFAWGKPRITCSSKRELDDQNNIDSR